jgi:hypothetical protein
MTGRGKTQREAIETMALLVAAGADVNAADTQGRTAAHGAALWGLTDVVRFLHKNGAAFDVKDKRGFTALDTAMGLAGGFGFDGRSALVQEETAKVIRELTGATASAPSPRPAPASPGASNPQDDREPRTRLADSTLGARSWPRLPRPVPARCWPFRARPRRLHAGASTSTSTSSRPASWQR